MKSLQDKLTTKLTKDVLALTFGVVLLSYTIFQKLPNTKSVDHRLHIKRGKRQKARGKRGNK